MLKWDQPFWCSKIFVLFPFCVCYHIWGREPWRSRVNYVRTRLWLPALARPGCATNQWRSCYSLECWSWRWRGQQPVSCSQLWTNTSSCESCAEFQHQALAANPTLCPTYFTQHNLTSRHPIPAFNSFLMNSQTLFDLIVGWFWMSWGVSEWSVYIDLTHTLP